MRTGDFKQTYGELVTLVDSPPVWLWSTVLVAALIVAPYVLNSYALSFLMIILITVVGGKVVYQSPNWKDTGLAGKNATEKK